MAEKNTIINEEMSVLSWDEMQARAKKFKKKWTKAEGNEEALAQSFQREMLGVFGINDPLAVGAFEHKVNLDDGHNGYIDYFYPSKIAIEMKSKGKDLNKAYEQLKNYVVHLEKEAMPELLMVCDMESFILYRRTTGERFNFLLKDFDKHLRKFSVLAGYETKHDYDNQIEVNIKAAEQMAMLHDELKAHGYEGHCLEIYLVRLLFCLFADDTGIFVNNDFLNYVENSKEDGSDLDARLRSLFEVLDMPDEVRKKRSLLSADLKAFRYINGGLFKEVLPMAEFNAKMRSMLIECSSFDWHKISPAIFGSMFQGVMDKKQRRELGAHYTSEENILKLIKPLFLDELYAEFERVKVDKVLLEKFHDKIANLKFLDPACGCGNFLIITYRELRRLELEVLKMQVESAYINLFEDVTKLIRVNVNQFYGIEIEDFPAQIAKVGMWLVDHQMNNLVSNYFGMYYVRLPLVDSATIVCDNALRIDWESVVPKNELNYILGNPPFAGSKFMTKEQRNEITGIYKGYKNSGVIDYVSGWFYKAADFMNETKIETAFVSTNSITQGEQVAAVWKPLYEIFNIHINFAYRTFKWGNEASSNALVYCVIIGYGNCDKARKLLYEDGKVSEVKNINAYLLPADDILVESRKKPISDVPEIGIGNQPIDGGHYLFTEEEMQEFILQEPASEKYFKPWFGANEFLYDKKRFCLWLGDCTPAELRKMPLCMKRIEAVKTFRLSSKRVATVKLADKPTRFLVENMPDKSYILIPEATISTRRYIPMGFLTPDKLCSNLVKIIPEGELYHFGVLTSNVHMAWMRATCGYYGPSYRYSKDIVYNNFPWCNPTEAQRAKIEKTAQGILDARALYPDSSLADLYDELTMPVELKKAHQANDRAVMEAYSFWGKLNSESECVAELMKMYQKLVGE